MRAAPDRRRASVADSRDILVDLALAGNAAVYTRLPFEWAGAAPTDR